MEIPNIVVQNALGWFYNHILTNRAELSQMMEDNYERDLQESLNRIMEEVGSIPKA